MDDLDSMDPASEPGNASGGRSIQETGKLHLTGLVLLAFKEAPREGGMGWGRKGKGLTEYPRKLERQGRGSNLTCCALSVSTGKDRTVGNAQQ